MDRWSFGSALRCGASARALAIALSAPMAAVPLSCAHAGGVLPTSGQYVAGTGAIAKKGSNGLAINQSSATGIIDWSSFSIGKGNNVQFNNGSGATLNRVTGGDLSAIAGSLKATGSLYLINPQGVIVSGSGKVMTGGSFIASSRDESDSDFLNNRRRFSGSSAGNVTNAGTIRSANGDVALIGSSVSNSGSMGAKNGTASLNAGNQVLLAPAGSRILVSGGVGNASNSGTLQAAQAQINAAGGNVYALAGNNGGIIRATGTKTVDGHVWLTSGAGNVTVSGKVQTKNADGSGGAVDVTAKNIVISGAIDASATKSTRLGGTVSVIAKDTTTLTGSIAARGGSKGQGGFVETSGAHLKVADSAHVTTLARDGLTGDWLIDPNDFTIAASGGDITGAQLSSNLGTTDVTIASGDGATAGNGDIFVNDAVSWSSAKTLTLNAQRNIEINANVAITGSGVLSLNTGLGGSGSLDIALGSGRIAFTNVTSGNNTALSINGQAYKLEDSVDDLATAIDTSPSGFYALATNYNAGAHTYSFSAPIAASFTGTFEGLGNTISSFSLAAATPTGRVGLFSTISGGIVRDLSLTNANITITGTDSNYSAGVLAGMLSNGVVSNVVVGGTVTSSGSAPLGGLIGVVQNNATVKNSFSAVSVSDTSSIATAGGFAGTLTSGSTIIESGASGVVTVVGDFSAAGGFVGLSTGAGVSDSYATGAVFVTGNQSYAGGFSGNHTSGNISGSFSTGNVTITGESDSAGGFAGYATAAIDSSRSAGDVKLIGNDGQVGGFVAYNALATISNSSSASTVSASGSDDWIGGFVGHSASVIENSFATGSVTTPTSTDNSAVGGFAGFNEGVITGSSALGSVTDNGSFNRAGGFVGDSIGTISGSYAGGDVSTTKSNSAGLVGGFAGILTSGVITDSSSGGAVSGGTASAAGGFVGENLGTVDHAYSTGAVSGATIRGGFVGYNVTGTIREAYEHGIVANGSGSVGAFAGQNDGSLGSVEAVFYNKTGNPTAAVGAGTGTGSAVRGLTSAQFMSVSSFTAGTNPWSDFGSSPVLVSWTIIDQDGSFNNAGGAAGGATPMLTSEYSTTIVDAHQLQLMQLDPTANYTLGYDVNASRTVGGDVWGSSGFIPVSGNAEIGFSGTLDGQGYAIKNLSINAPSQVSAAGLFGLIDGGTVKNLSLQNISVVDSATILNFALGGVGALAGSVVGSTVSGVSATGAVSGLGNADVGGLIGYADLSTVTASSSGASVAGKTGTAGGLIGNIDTSTVSDSYATGVVQAESGPVGGFAGLVSGGSEVDNSYATGAATALGSDGDGGNVGGFVGTNLGVIDASYATGAATGGAFSNVGGFAGFNDHSITNAYATGAVTGDEGGGIGGFIGFNQGTIDSAYSIGSVSGRSSAIPGGFAGGNAGDITNSYWDVETSGLANATSGSDGSLDGIAGETTAQMQSVLLSGFDNAVWGTSTGTFPYLRWKYPHGAVGISGYAYSDFAGTALKAASLTFAAAGKVLGSSSTGANGYYYVLASPTDDAYEGASLLAYTAGGAAASLGRVDVADETDLIFQSGFLSTHVPYVDGNQFSNFYFHFSDNLDVAIGGNSQIQSIADGLGLAIGTQGGMNFDQAFNFGNRNLMIYAAFGSVTQNASISAGGLLLEGNADFELTDSANHFGVLAAENIGSLDALGDVFDVGTVAGIAGISAANGVILQSMGGTIAINANVSTTSSLVYLDSAMGISEASSAKITSPLLSGIAHGAATLTGANRVDAIGAFSASSIFSFTDAQTLTVSGNVTAAGVVLTTTGAGHNIVVNAAINDAGHTLGLNSAGTITQGAAGILTAGTLTGRSVGATTLTDANRIGALGAFTATGVLALTDAQTLTVSGNVTGAGVVLTTTGAGHNIAVNAAINDAGHTLGLNSAGTITQGASGILTAGTLTGKSVGATTLSDANRIAALGAFTATGALGLTDAQTLSVNGTLTAAGVVLTTTGAGHNLVINAAINDAGHTLGLNSAGTITQGAAGILTAGTLTGKSAGATTLNAANKIATLGSFTSATNFALTDAQALKVAGPLTASASNATVALTTTAGNLTFTGAVKGATVTLKTAGEATQTTTSAITTSKLNVTAKTGINLVGANHIKAVGTRVTTSGPNVIKGIGS